VTLSDALRLLSLPRVVGHHPDSGVEIRTNFGPSGPYVALMTDPRPDYRSLEEPEQVFSLTLDGALGILAQPKVFRRGRGAAKPEVVVGTDPTTNRKIILKEGRFGPYVTDGETNASLGKVDDPTTLSVERASDLLAERRLAEPSGPKKSARGSRSGTSTSRSSARTATKRPAKRTSK
ncbi:MAG: DNA topoisomerase I, partial [Actinobacteria bacterium]|nr:DNA topoisomerase I [Actinomycetota bacterium]